MEFAIGTRVDHGKYGQGIVSKVNFTNYDVIFIRGGERQINKNSPDLTVMASNEVELQEPQRPSLQDFEEIINAVFSKHDVHLNQIQIAEKFRGGNLVLEPQDPNLSVKEMSIESFFHKIVMVRDRLRVLEQNINSHPKLDDQDKVNLQQYITRSYGSLTTFNVLFQEKADGFKGTGKSK